MGWAFHDALLTSSHGAAGDRDGLLADAQGGGAPAGQPGQARDRRYTHQLLYSEATLTQQAP